MTFTGETRRVAELLTSSRGQRALAVAVGVISVESPGLVLLVEGVLQLERLGERVTLLGDAYNSTQSTHEV